MSQKPEPSPDEGARAHLDQIRELLFGDEARSSRKRLQKAESRLGAEVAELTERLQAGMARLDERGRDERAALADRLEAHRARSETVEQETGESLAALGRALERLGERQTQQLTELRAELDRKLHELSERVERSLSLLDARKTDRELLARLLGELAKGLNAPQDGPAHGQPASPRDTQRGADTRR